MIGRTKTKEHQTMKNTTIINSRTTATPTTAACYRCMSHTN
jgi:hypothetical protein